MTSQTISRRSVLSAAAVTAAAALADPGLSAPLAPHASSTGQSSPSPSSFPPSVFPSHPPLGRGIGVMPGRVVWAHDPASVNWDGRGYWWETKHFDDARVRTMLDRAVVSLAGLSVPAQGAPANETLKEAWQKLFANFNLRAHGKSSGYAAGEKIAVKVNMNGAGAYTSTSPEKTEESYGNAVLMRALLMSLVEGAGAAPEDIVFYDAGRLFPQFMMDYVGAAPCEGVAFRHRTPHDPAHDAAADKAHPVVWSGTVRGETSAVPACVVGANYLINLANLKGHCYGLTLCGKNHFGSFVNSDRERAPQAAGLHGNVAGARHGNYSVLVDLMGHKELGGKTVLYLLDGLLTAVGESVSLTEPAARWSMPPFSGGFCASLFASQDPVAVDSVGCDFLMNEPNVTRRNSALRGNAGVENYLHEAAQADHPPSGTAYTNSEGQALSSLGVHDHWNNPLEKLYGRNLGKPEGIELVRV